MCVTGSRALTVAALHQCGCFAAQVHQQQTGSCVCSLCVRVAYRTCRTASELGGAYDAVDLLTRVKA
jgi:hypothetical protein